MLVSARAGGKANTVAGQALVDAMQAAAISPMQYLPLLRQSASAVARELVLRTQQSLPEVQLQNGLQLLECLCHDELATRKPAASRAKSKKDQTQATALLQTACTTLPAMMAVLCQNLLRQLLASKLAAHKKLALVRTMQRRLSCGSKRRAN